MSADFLYIHIYIYIYIFPKQRLHLRGSYLTSIVIRLNFMIACRRPICLDLPRLGGALKDFWWGESAECRK